MTAQPLSSDDSASADVQRTNQRRMTRPPEVQKEPTYWWLDNDEDMALSLSASTGSPGSKWLKPKTHDTVQDLDSFVQRLKSTTPMLASSAEAELLQEEQKVFFDGRLHTFQAYSTTPPAYLLTIFSVSSWIPILYG